MNSGASAAVLRLISVTHVEIAWGKYVYKLSQQPVMLSICCCCCCQVAKNPTVLQKFVLDSWDPKLKEVLLKSFCAHPRERLCPAQAIQILCGQGKPL